jgi:hypothetical protein
MHNLIIEAETNRPNNKVYAGVGSRRTPESALRVITDLATPNVLTAAADGQL